MTKEDTIEKVGSLNLAENSYVVFGSGPMAVFNIREVNDIDLYVSEEVYEDLKKEVGKN